MQKKHKKEQNECAIESFTLVLLLFIFLLVWKDATEKKKILLKWVS